MSFPTDQLAGLSIKPRMSQRTRTEAQRARRRREREERISMSSFHGNQGSILPSPDEEGIISGNTTLRYQVGTMRSPLQIAAIRGLTADNLSAEAAKAHVQDIHGSYVAIQVIERLRLCIYATPRNGRRLDCSCPEMRGRVQGTICPHIYWLYDRVASLQYPQSDASSVWSINLPEIENVLGPITRRSSIDIECLAEEISPIWTEADEEIDHEVGEILAVLDPDRERLSDDYDEDFYAQLPASPNHRYQDLVVPNNLFKTIFALARHDPIFRERLSAAITRDGLDKDFLRKINRRRISAFSQLDTYINKGSKMNPREIGQCSMKLRDVISKIGEYRERVHETPNPLFDRTCAKIMIKMLQEICGRNRDIYKDMSWLKESPPSQPQDRNLFNCIMSGWNQPRNPETQFIFDFLIDELTPQASFTSLRELTEILAKLKEFKAPGPLVARVEQFIRDIRNEPQLPPLSEIENFQSLTPSSTRSPRTISHSSSGSCSSNNNEEGSSQPARRRPSTLEMPEAQRRRLQ